MNTPAMPSRLSRLAKLQTLEHLSNRHQQACLPLSVFLLRLPEVLEALQMSRSSAYARLDPKSKYFDPTFPRPISLSPSGGRGIAWVSSEVEAWIQQQVEKRDSTLASTSVARNANPSNLPADKSAYRSSHEKLRDEDAFLPDIHSTWKASAIRY